MTFLDLPATSYNIGVPHHQGGRRRAFCQIYINGVDVTNIFEPFLISVQVQDKSSPTDEAFIELDDRDAKLLPPSGVLPPVGSPVRIHLGWAGSGPIIPLFQHVQEVYDLPIPEGYIPPNELGWASSGMMVIFQGWTESVESGFSRRGGGRRLWIECKGGDMSSGVKSHQHKTMGQGDPPPGVGGSTGGVSLQSFMQSVAPSGMGVFLDPKIGGLTRNFWQMNESFMNFGMRMAEENGGNFKIVGNAAVIAESSSSVNVFGEPMPNLEARWGSNLIQWRIKPFVARPDFKSSSRNWFDQWSGKFKQVTSAIGGNNPFGSAMGALGAPGMAPNGQTGQQQTGGDAHTSRDRRSVGWVIINGEPNAKANSNIQIIGARPGVDGNYKVEEAEHNYSRSGGYTTRCLLKNYSGGDVVPAGHQATNPAPRVTVNRDAFLGIARGAVGTGQVPNTAQPQGTTAIPNVDQGPGRGGT